MRIYKNTAILSIIIFLSGCVASSIDKINITEVNDGSKNIVVVSTDLVYKNKKYNGNTCDLVFVDEEGKDIFAKVKGKYAFLYTEADQIRLDRFDCISLRVLYNQFRRHKVEDKVSYKIQNNKINYIGDITAYWNPEAFHGSDLFPFGMMSIIMLRNDEGLFKMKIDDNYNDYMKFMIENYPQLLNKVVNSSPTNYLDKNLK